MQKNFQFRSFVKALGLGQKPTLESFQFWVMATFSMIFQTWVKITLFSEIWIIVKDIRSKGDIFRQSCAYIWRFYKVLVQLRFATSKTELDISHTKNYIRVNSRLAKRLRILANQRILGKSQNLMGTMSSVQSPLQNEFLVLLNKN